MKTILFATDLSPRSESAEKFAVEIAKIKNAKLILLYVETKKVDMPIYSTFRDVDVMEKETPIQLLNSIIKKHGLTEHVHACFVENGKIVNSIIHEIEKKNVDLVVMGNSGNHNFERKNSNTTEVIRRAKCSVLAIPDRTEYKPIKNVVYATDLIHKDEQSFKHLISFAKAFEAELTLLHINVKGVEDLGKAPFKSFSEIREVINYPNCNEKKISAEGVVEGIEEFVKENEVDVVAMTSHSTSFLDKFFRESNTKKLALISDLPLLTFSK